MLLAGQLRDVQPEHGRALRPGELALLLAVLLLGVFRAGYIPSGFIYTQF